MIPTDIVAASDNITRDLWVLDVTRRIMPLYEEMFDIEYPLPKLDILVVSAR